MSSSFMKLLIKGDKEGIQNYIEDEEFSFYSEDNKEKVIQMNYVVPNYDTLMDVLGIKDGAEPIASDMAVTENTMNVVDVYKTQKTNLYFIRMEQYGHADEDATISQLVYTYDLGKSIKNCKELLSKRDIVAEAKKFNEELKKIQKQKQKQKPIQKQNDYFSR